MATVPTAPTWTAGDNATSTKMQSTSDAANYGLGTAASTGAKKPLTRVYQTSSTTSLADSTWVSITFDAETVDYDNSHNTTTFTSRFTANTTGWHWVSGQIAYAGNSTGLRRARLAVTGAEYVASAVEITNLGTAVQTVVIPAQPVFLTAGTDYVEIQGWQSSGGALATSIGAAGGAGASHLNVLWVSN